MYFARSFLLALITAPFVVFAQNANPFNIPSSGLDTSAGQTLNLSWKPTTSGTVSLILRSGANGNLNAGTPIAQSIPNSGSYSWQVPSSITRGSSYTIEIVSDGDTSQTNYTPQFVIDSSNTASSASSGSSTMSATSSGITSSASTSASTSGSKTSSGSASSTSGSASSTSGSMTTSRASSASSASGSSSASTTGSASASASSNSAGFQSASGSAASQSKNAAPRMTAAAGIIGAVALGALAL